MLLLLVRFGAAAQTTTPKSPDGLRIGMEIELRADHFAKIVHLFDFKQFQNDVERHTSNPRPGDSLTEPEALFRILPEEIVHEAKSLPWENLSAISKAKLAIALAWPARADDFRLELRTDAPPAIKKLFGKLEWHRDRYKMEFKHAVPESDLATYIQDVRAFARLAGVEDKILNETKSPAHGVAYHFHLSGPQKIDKSVLKKFNRLLLLKKLSMGFTEDLTETVGLGLFRDDLNARGLVRQISDTRFETRVHPFDFHTMLDLALSLHDSDPEKAKQKITALSHELFTPEVFHHVLRHAPPFLSLFESLMSEAQKETYRKARKIHLDHEKDWSLAEVRNVLDVYRHLRPDAELYVLLLKFSFDGDPAIQKEATDYLEEAMVHFPAQIWESFMSSVNQHLTENPGSLIAFLIRVQNQPSEALRQKLRRIRIPELMKDIQVLLRRSTCAPFLNPGGQP